MASKTGCWIGAGRYRHVHFIATYSSVSRRLSMQSSDWLSKVTPTCCVTVISIRFVNLSYKNVMIPELC